MRERAPWKEVRAKYEGGGYSFRSLAEEYGVSKQTVATHAGKEGWSGTKRWHNTRVKGSRQCLREAASGLLEVTRQAVRQVADGGEADVKELKELAGILQTLAGLERTLNGAPAEGAARDATVQVVMGEEVEEMSR